MSIRREAMRATKMTKAISMSKLLPVVMMAVASLFTATAHASTPGITGPTFNLSAAPAYLTQPDGAAVYSWGYGCNGAPSGFAPAAIPSASTFCNVMQVPGPTLIVTENTQFTVMLTNQLPSSAGNTSILFPGLTLVGTSGGVPGLLTQEATSSSPVTYTLIATSPGTRAYYSGTQGDLQVEMGLYGAIVVLPASVPTNCSANANTPPGGLPFSGANGVAETNWGEKDFRLASAAYNNAHACYDREYLFQFSEMDERIHSQALAQVNAT